MPTQNVSTLCKEVSRMSAQDVWGPPFWFFLHTVAHHYPITPNQVTKRKYYDLVQNFPLFLPDEGMGKRFAELLDKYPVTPYLDDRTSFRRWVHFIHNQVNREVGKPVISWTESVAQYERTLLGQTPAPAGPMWTGSPTGKDLLGGCILVALGMVAFAYSSEV